MKKIFYLLALILLVVNINVFASEDEGVTLSLDCENLNLSRGGTATCDLNVSTISTISVDNVSLDIESDTDLTIIYTKGQFFDGNLNSGHLVLTASSLKTGNFKLGKITISVSDSATYEKKTITLKNISFTDSSNTTQIYKADNVLKEVNILSNNNNLKSISVDGKDIASFSSDTQKYDLEVEADKVNISAIAEEKDIAQIDGIGEKKLEYGKNIFEIKVTSQKGNIKTYTLNITRPDKRSDVNTLKTLTLDGINFRFDSKNLNYKINVESDVDKIKIDSTLSDSKATYVKDFGNREVDLAYGENKVLIKVLSEKGNEKVYTITLNRADNRSDVAKLTFLKINDIQVKLSDDVYEYEVSLLYRITKTEIEAIANEKSTLKYNDIDLNVGNNELIIKVVSEKETEKEYKINVKRRTEDESKAIIEDIIVSGYELNFTKDINSYNLKLNQEDTELKIEVLSNDIESVTYAISGNKNLKNGSVVTINAKDDLGEYIYTINILKDVDEQLILGILTINQICYIVFSIGCLLFLCSIIYAIKAKNSKKK